MPSNSLLKILYLCIFIALLSQCTSITGHQEKRKPAQETFAAPYTMPASTYLALAEQHIGEEQQHLLLMAAGRQIYDGQWQEGLTTLKKTSDNLSPTQRAEKDILLSNVDMMHVSAKASVTRLLSIENINTLPPFYQRQYHEILAKAYEAIGNANHAMIERIDLENFLSNDNDRTNNRRALWFTLAKLSLKTLHSLASDAKEEASLQGWLELALIARKLSSDNGLNLQNIQLWKAHYPEHPANSLLPKSLSAITPYLTSPPRKMALLLPLSGPLAGPGEAIRDGFMAMVDPHNNSTKVNCYDTAKESVETLYDRALSDGAEYIVGPLSKSDVTLVANLQHPVPTLLLNDTETNAHDNMYRFGLSLPNEAKEVALKASTHSYNKALIISPAGQWGDDIVAAFISQWEATGGVVVDKLSYANNTDLTLSLRTLLQVNDDHVNHKKLAPQTEERPKRRQDFDMIFLLAYPSKGRQIMPLLKYYFAGDVPVFSISTIYSGTINAMKDKDLDGIVFCDMAWVFNHQMGSRNWPEQLNSYNRLYALGVDAYALATHLNQLLLFPAIGIHDKNGILYLNQAQVSRLPEWGQFKQGVAMPWHANG